MQTIKHYIIILLFISGCSLPLNNSNNQLQNVAALGQVNEFITKGNNFLSLADEINTENIKKRELLDSALSSFSLAKEINSNDPRGIDGIASVLIRKGNFLEAATLLTNLIVEHENYARAYVNLSYIKEKNGNLLEAESLLNKALNIDPLEAHALNNLGGLIYDRGMRNKNTNDITRGKQLITKASLILNPRNKVIKQNLNAIRAVY